MAKTDIKDGDVAIHGALRLNYEATKLVEYYDDWVKNYDQDVHYAGYVAPTYIADCLGRILELHGQTVDNTLELEILDAGCGTGLVGKALHDRGYRYIDGFDLCASMVEKANEPGVYRALNGGCDITKVLPYSDGHYDITICCGVFTQGHVPPNALNELVRITKSQGILLVSTRKSYYESTEFEDICQQLETTGLARRIYQMMDGPYLDEEGAHYWAFLIS